MPDITMRQPVSFLRGAARIGQCPPDTGAEVAFAGRSNAGKSSVINAIVGRTGLARSSRTPGRTRLLNFFQIGEEDLRLVDLPGYGYAQVSRKERMQWRPLLDSFIAHRRSLRGLILIMDVRHPLKPGDRQMLLMAEQRNLAVHVLLNKADKPGGNVLRATRHAVCAELQGSGCSVQLFSARNRDGVEEALERIWGWLRPQESLDSEEALRTEEVLHTAEAVSAEGVSREDPDN